MIADEQRASYPVLTQVGLPDVRRERFRRARRAPGDLPPSRPGAIYVFKTGGTFVAYGERHVDFADPVVVDATEVSLVQVRPRQVSVGVTIASTEPTVDFTVLATFRCRVVSPAAVAEAGLTDLDSIIVAHLAGDSMLASLGEFFDPDSVQAVRRRADAQVRAYWEVARPDVDGVEMRLLTVQVRTAVADLNDDLPNGRWL